MSLLSRSALTTDINNNIYNNSSRDISGLDVGNRMINIIDSLVSKTGDTGILDVLRYSAAHSISNAWDLTHKTYVDDLVNPTWKITGNTLAARGTFGSISGAFGWGYKINDIFVGGFSNNYEPYFGTDTEFDNTFFSIKEKELVVAEGTYGTIYNASSWVNTSNFANNGLTAVMTGSKILLTGGSGTFDKSFDLLGSSCLEKWRVVAQLKITALGYGFGIGMRSSNVYQSYNMLGRLDTSSGDSYLNGPDGTQNAVSGAALAISLNDVVELDLERNVNVLTLRVRNVTTSSAIITTTYTYLLSSSYLHNTGRFSIFGFGGNAELYSLVVTSNEVTNANVMVIGDSKTQGYFATSFAGRFTTQLNADFTSAIISAGGSDRTVEVLLRINEIIALSPRKVILCIGSNDPRSGRSSGAFQTDYQSISTQLLAAGIDVYYCLPFPEDVQDLTSQKTWIQSTFIASKIIDTWTPLLDGAYGLKTVYDNGDGIHPNQEGNDAIYNIIKTSQFTKSVLRVKNILDEDIFNMLKTGTLLLKDGLGFNGKKQIYGNGDNVGFGGASYGSGVGVQFFANATTVSTSNPVGGFINYGEGGIAKWRSSAGGIIALPTGSGVLSLESSMFETFVDGGNGTTVETDLYSYTTTANRLNINGEKLEAEYGGVFVSSGTATRQIKIYFGGSIIFDTGALTLSLSSAWTAYVTIIRVSDTVVRYMVSFATQGAALSAYTSTGEVTALTLSATNILKITGQAAGVGAATNDIVLKLGQGKWITKS